MQEKGIVLLFTLIMIVIISMITISLLGIVGKENITAIYYQYKLENKYLLQAAVAKAKHQAQEKLAVNNHWRNCDLKGLNFFGSLRYKSLSDSKKVNINYRLNKIYDEQGKANINYLSQIQLKKLPGIESNLADKIQQRRNKKQFVAKEELKNIKGVGERKYKKLKSFITVLTSEKININTASYQVLQMLKNIGPSKAAKIITYRQMNGAFKTKEELKDVPGIGLITYQYLADQIIVESNLFTIVLKVSIPERNVKQEVRKLIKLKGG